MSKKNKVPKLLPCPFCGADAEWKQVSPTMEDKEIFWRVGCTAATAHYFERGLGCPVQPVAVGSTLKEAYAAWNTRSGR